MGNLVPGLGGREGIYMQWEILFVKAVSEKLSSYIQRGSLFLT